MHIALTGESPLAIGRKRDSVAGPEVDGGSAVDGAGENARRRSATGAFFIEQDCPSIGRDVAHPGSVEPGQLALRRFAGSANDDSVAAFFTRYQQRPGGRSIEQQEAAGAPCDQPIDSVPLDGEDVVV